MHRVLMEGRSNINSDGSKQTSSEAAVLQLAQSHFSSQALLVAIRLGALDVLNVAHDDNANDVSLTVDEIITKIQDASSLGINRDALFRCLRLLCTTGVIEEIINEDSDTSAYVLTEIGRLLQRQSAHDVPSMAPFILHWAENPLWNAWAQLPDYVTGKTEDGDKQFDGNIPPFDRANGMSASAFYKTNAVSSSHRNAVARYASTKEIDSILDAMQSSSVLNESNLAGKIVCDIGGGYGDLMHAMKISMPNVEKCYCLDLPDVIEDAKAIDNSDFQDKTVTLVSGDMFDASTIPTCDIIITKHVLCDFSDDDVVRALQVFHKSLTNDGKVIIMDAVLPNGNDLNGQWNAAVSFDVLLMLSGRRGERSQLEWSSLARKAGFVLESVISTSSVTVDLAVLSIAS